MPTAEAILRQLQETYQLEEAFVGFPEGTLPLPNEHRTIGRIWRGNGQTIRLDPVSIVERGGFKHLEFFPTLKLTPGQDLLSVDFTLHPDLELAIFGRIWENNRLKP